METLTATPVTVTKKIRNGVLRFQDWIQKILEKITFGIRVLTGSFYILVFLTAFFWRIAYVITGKQDVQVVKTNISVGPLVPGTAMPALYWWFTLFVMSIINIYAISRMPEGGVKSSAEKNFGILLFLYNFSYFCIVTLFFMK